MATKTAKTPNFTDEQTAELRAGYLASPTKETVEAFAVKFGKNTRSIIAKLSRMEIYKKPEYTTKKGEKPVKKDELADRMQAAFGLTEAEASSLEKANKTALQKILAAVEGEPADKPADE